MSIRLRVALLALMAIVGVVAALVFVYRDIRTEIALLEMQATRNAWAQESSQLIHMLQRERGSSGGFLVKPEPEYLERVKNNRRNTDASLATLVASRGATPALITAAGLDLLGEQLKAKREQIDSGQVNWVVVRDFYTFSITEVLDVIAQEVRAGKSGTSHELAAIGELAAAREAMGLIRATIYYISSQAKPSARDFVDLAIYAGLYRQHIHNFVRDADARQRDWSREYFRSRAYSRVMAVIEASMISDFILAPVDSGVWWERATQVIDTLKEKEDLLYADLRQSSVARIGEINNLLTLFGISAVLIALVISAFALLTIGRIMKALGSLIGTFDAVVEKENFSIRARSEASSDEFAHIGRLLNRLLDFTDSLISEKEHLAATDALTGIMNRRSFLKYADREIERAHRYGAELALLFIDIDFFKQVNDVFGHSIGDEVLKRFVQVLGNRLRATDVLARWGGEEFVVLIPESNADKARQIGEILRAVIEAEEIPSVGHITCSIGVAAWMAQESFDALCKRADDALYEAKSTGRNKVCCAARMTDHVIA